METLQALWEISSRIWQIMIYKVFLFVCKFKWNFLYFISFPLCILSYPFLSLRRVWLGLLKAPHQVFINRDKMSLSLSSPGWTVSVLSVFSYITNAPVPQLSLWPFNGFILVWQMHPALDSVLQMCFTKAEQMGRTNLQWCFPSSGSSMKILEYWPQYQILWCTTSDCPWAGFVLLITIL